MTGVCDRSKHLLHFTDCYLVGWRPPLTEETESENVINDDHFLIILYYIISFYIILYYTILSYIILYYIILYHFILYYIISSSRRACALRALGLLLADNALSVG